MLLNKHGNKKFFFGFFTTLAARRKTRFVAFGAGLKTNKSEASVNNYKQRIRVFSFWERPTMNEMK